VDISDEMAWVGLAGDLSDCMSMRTQCWVVGFEAKPFGVIKRARAMERNVLAKVWQIWQLVMGSEVETVGVGGFLHAMDPQFESTFLTCIHLTAMAFDAK
jgi:hypothetical protein